MSFTLGTLLGSAGIAQIAGDALDKVNEIIFGERTKDLLQDVKDRSRSFLTSVPTNHDLERAIRYTELTSTIVLLDDCRKQHEGEHFDERSYRLPPFFDRAKEWLHQQIGLCPSLELVDNHRIVADVEAVLNRALASDNKDPAEQALFEATQTAWSDLTKAISAPPPDGLESRFFGREPGKPGWAALFVAFIREQLKDNSRAQVAFVVSRLASVAERLRASETHLREMRVDVAKLLSYVEEERQKRGIAEGFIREVAGRIVSDEGLNFESQQRAIRNAIEIYVKEIAGGVTQSNVDAIVDAALKKAKTQVDKGQSGLARATLRRAADEMRREERERRERYEQGARLLYQRERDIALAGYDGEAAAQAVVELAEALHGDHHARLWRELTTEQDALYEFGRDRGSNVHLIAAIELDRRLAVVAQTADETGYSYNSLGIALETLGGRENGTARLEEAVAAYRAALEERTRERVPLDWAMIQNNLGIALERLGERERGTARLEEAVAAYRAALEERTRKRVPLDWAMTQNNLGIALETLGGRESGTARLEEAVAVYRSALEELTRERVPLDWAMTQNNLGNGLRTLGMRESGTARLEEAVTAYRAALKELTRERVPLQWAGTQNNLGAALRTLGERENGTARLEEAVAAYRAALEERTRERVPLYWAATQNNLGIALERLGARESGTGRLEEAVAAYRAALEERTRERVPFDWAMTQNNLGAALQTLGVRESGTARLEEAVAAYRAALEERTRERVPLDWATSLGNQGVVMRLLAERTGDGALARQALTQIETALETMEAGGHEPNAAFYRAQIPAARALVEKLRGG